MAQPLQRILVAVDDSPSCQPALKEAIALAKASGAELVLAHVTSILEHRIADGGRGPHRVPDVASTPLGPACSRVESAGVRWSTELLLGYPPKQLALVADDRDVDLIVVGSRNLKGLKRAALGSTSNVLLKESSRPVLVVSSPERAIAAA